MCWCRNGSRSFRSKLTSRRNGLLGTARRKVVCACLLVYLLTLVCCWFQLKSVDLQETDEHVCVCVMLSLLKLYSVIMCLCFLDFTHKIATTRGPGSILKLGEPNARAPEAVWASSAESREEPCPNRNWSGIFLRGGGNQTYRNSKVRGVVRSKIVHHLTMCLGALWAPLAGSGAEKTNLAHFTRSHKIWHLWQQF